MKKIRGLIAAALLTGGPGLFAQTITCSVLPPVYYFDTAAYRPAGELLVGQARLYPVWSVNADAYIPQNRITWAMAMAHAHQLFRNATGTEMVPLNTYFATPLKESFCGCDTFMQPNPLSIYPLSYQAASVYDGCFQIEGPGSAYAELHNLYPQRFPANGHPQFIGGEHFETAALSKAYYDLYAIRYLELSRNWDPIGFAAQATDTLAGLKALLAAYNRGLWDPLIQDIFDSSRTQALAATDLLSLFPANSVVLDYATNITNHVLTLSNQVSALPAPLQPVNSFHAYYDEQVTAADIHHYLDLIFPLYPDADTAQVRLLAINRFNCINGGGPISFRYQFGDVLDVLLLNLPADDPGENIVISYGCNGVWPDTNWVPTYLPGNSAPNYADCQALAVSENELHDEVRIYPNPASGNALLLIEADHGSIESASIFDTNGRLCMHETFADQRTRRDIQLPALAPGSYIVRIKTATGNVHKLFVITP